MLNRCRGAGEKIAGCTTGRGVSFYNDEMYSAQVLDHFQNPRNAGEIQNPDVRVQMENPACGDILELTAKITSGRIAEMRFRAKGCVSAMACASRLDRDGGWNAGRGCADVPSRRVAGESRRFAGGFTACCLPRDRRFGCAGEEDLTVFRSNRSRSERSRPPKVAVAVD